MKKAFTLIAVIASFSINVFSQDCIWKGSADSSWNNPLNWSCNSMPDSNTTVYIFSGTGFNPVVSGTVRCRHLIIIDSIKQYIEQSYQVLAGDQGYGKVLSMYTTVDNDETMFSPAFGTSTVNDRRSLARYGTTPENVEIERPFIQLYNGIQKTNYCIKFLSKLLSVNFGSDTFIAKHRRMYGEALTLRAQMYFELVRNWGDVPYSDSTNFLLIGNYGYVYPPMDMQNADRDTTYSKILNDLLLAENYLPWRTELASMGDTLDERITKGAAKALRARIALFAGGYSLRTNGTKQRSLNYLDFYQVTKQECLDLMNHREQHTLNPQYKAIWKNTICAHKVDDGYGEIIFQAKMAGGTSLADSKLGYYNGPKINSFGNASLLLLPTYFYSFDSIDTRRDVMAAPYDVVTDSITKKGVRLHEIRDGKFRRDWISNPSIASTDAAQYFSLNWPLIRFADVLLMFAEADNELNGSASPAAIAAFEEVRRRGYGINASLIGNTPTDKISFFNAIVKERALELGGEGIRKYDLIRWNLLETKILETKANLNKMAAREAPYDNLPIFMYYNTNTTADDASIWANSLYNPGPTLSSAIPGATRVTWTNNSSLADPATSPIVTSTLAYFALYFISNTAELLPYHTTIMNLNPGITQNPNY